MWLFQDGKVLGMIPSVWFEQYGGQAAIIKSGMPKEETSLGLYTEEFMKHIKDVK